MTELVNDNLNEVLKSSEKVVLVDMFAEWCGPCKMIAPIIDELGKEYDGKIDIVKVDVDSNPQSAAAYGVRSIPTLLVFKNGTIVNKQVGAIPKSKIVELFSKHV